MKLIPYIVAIGAGFVATSMVWLGALYAQIGVPTNSSEWIYEANTVKMHAAESQQGPKLLIVSGSNSLFGVSAHQISEEIRIPTVNLAIHAGLGLRYILHQARKATNPGDLIVLPLEYELYDQEVQANEVLIDYVFSRDPSYLATLSPLEQMQFAFAIEPKRLAKGIAGIILTPSPNVNGYRAETLNHLGDETHNKKSMRTTPMLNALKREKPSRISQEGFAISNESSEQIKEFVAWCKKRGVRVIATYPSLMFQKEYESPQTAINLDAIRRYYDTSGIPILGSPRMFMYPLDLYYDTKYHLTDIGMAERTKQLGILLAPFVEAHLASLKSPSKVSQSHL